MFGTPTMKYRFRPLIKKMKLNMMKMDFQLVPQLVDETLDLCRSVCAKKLKKKTILNLEPRMRQLAQET